MPEENQRITREHLPGLLLARAIWERGPSLYFPPALKTATDQARACSLEMKTHCVELYRDAPELHEVVLASEALARIAELEGALSWHEEQRNDMAELRAELAAIKAQEPVRYWFIGDAGQEKGSRHCKKSSQDGSLAFFESEFDAKRAARRHAGTEVYTADYYAAPVSEAKAHGVVMPEPDIKTGHGYPAYSVAAVTELFARLKAAPVQQPKCKTCDDNGRIGGPSFYAPDEGGEPCPDCSAPVQQVSVPPFAQKVIRKLERFQECMDDGQGADIGRHWFDLLTQLGLLNRVQRSPALWEITQQGEDLLVAAPAAPGAKP